MSSGSQDSQETRVALLGALTRELRRFTGLGAAFVRAAAARTGMAVTDIEVIDILDSIGPTTAGQLAELTGLTTGAITGMLKRLEEAGFVRRDTLAERLLQVKRAEYAVLGRAHRQLDESHRT